MEPAAGEPDGDVSLRERRSLRRRRRAAAPHVCELRAAPPAAATPAGLCKRALHERRARGRAAARRRRRRLPLPPALAAVTSLPRLAGPLLRFLTIRITITIAAPQVWPCDKLLLLLPLATSPLPPASLCSTSMTQHTVGVHGSAMRRVATDVKPGNYLKTKFGPNMTDVHRTFPNSMCTP